MAYRVINKTDYAKIMYLTGINLQGSNSGIQ